MHNFPEQIGESSYPPTMTQPRNGSSGFSEANSLDETAKAQRADGGKPKPVGD